MAKESDEIKLTACDHDDGCCDDAHEQYREHVDAGKGECQNENIGDELHQVVIGGDDFMGVRCKRNSCNNHDCGDGCGERNPEVLLEFVLHFAALRGSRCDSRVGNEREVITEHGSANHGTHAEGNAEPCCPGNFNSDRRYDSNCPDGCPHGGRNECRHDEKHDYGKLGRYKIQKQVSGRRGAGSSENARENACAQEYENHEEDISIADGTCHDVHLLVEIQFAVLDACHENGYQEGPDDWDVVESHRNLQDVFEGNAHAQVQYQKHGDWQKGLGVALDVFNIFDGNAFVLHAVKDK